MVFNHLAFGLFIGWGSLPTNDLVGGEVQDEWAVISNIITDWHGSGINDVDVFCGPDGINRLGSSEACHSDGLTRYRAHTFYHV